MAKYLLKANYTSEGTKGLLREGGSARRAAVEKLITTAGGKMEAFYYAFGDSDAIVLMDLPDNVTAAAASMVANASGVVSVSITPLMTVEEIDAATKKSVQYRPPGQ